MQPPDTTAADNHLTEPDTRHGVAASVVSHLLVAYAAHAPDHAERLFEQLGLVGPHRFDFAQRVPEEAVLGVFDRLGPTHLDLGLQAIAAPSGHFSPVYHLAAAAEVVADLFDVAVQYSALEWTRLAYRAVLDDERVTLVTPAVPERPGAWLLQRYLTAEMIFATKHAFAAAPVQVLRLELPGPPTPTEGWHALADEVVFDCAEVRVVSPRSVLDVPCAQPNPSLSGWLRYVLDQRLAELPRTANLSHEVAELVRRRLAQPPDRGTTAAVLGLTPRTLARRLADEGTSFRAIVDAQRLRAATDWLLDHGIAEVSERLGFADPRSFQRAFQRWTGLSPSAWRQQVQS